jgi:phosphoesterase RecJ-like protein
MRLGKEVLLCSAGPFSRKGVTNHVDQFIEKPSPEQKAGVRVIVVDCSTMERTGSLQEEIEGLPCAIIDHHDAVTHPPSSVQTPVYIDANAPSCTLLIEKLLNVLGLELTEEEASLLLFGLCTDTGFFRHMTEKDGAAFEAVARMVNRGASPKKLFNLMSGGKSLESRILMGRVLSRVESHFDGKLLLSHETLEDLNAFGLESRDTDALVQMMFSVEGVEAMVIIRQECADNHTVSLRSVDKIDVAQIAASLGGGGHKNAAGLTLKESASNIKKIMLNRFAEIFV